MKRNPLAACLCGLLITLTLTGCDDPLLSTAPPTTLPITAPTEEIIIPEIPVVYDEKTFDHSGLQITLDESYQTRTDGSTLYFENDTVRGGIAFGNVATLTNGMATTSEGFAQYLKNSLSPYISQISTGAHNNQHHVLISGNGKNLLRTLYVHGSFAWNVWAETLDAPLVDSLTKAIDTCSLLPDQIPEEESASQQVELSGLTLSAGTVSEEVRSGENLTALLDDIPCQIATGSIALLTNNITPAIMAQEALDALEEAKDTAQLAEENGVNALIVPTAEGYTVTGYYIKNGRYWTVTAQGPDSVPLLTLVTSATTDDLSFTRLLRYNLTDYESFAALVQALEAAGSATWGRYTLRLDGLSVPMTLRLYGTKLESISIFTHTVDLTHPCYLDSESVLTQQEDLVILNLWQGKTGYTWLFTPEMYQYYYPTGGTSLMVFPEEDGTLRFTHHTLRFRDLSADTNPSAFLNHAINRKEFYCEAGTAAIVDGQLALNPQTEYTLSDICDMEALFTEAKGLGLFFDCATLDDLLYQNLIQYPR